MRLHPPSVHPKTQNTERTHFVGQPEQNKFTSPPPTNPQTGAATEFPAPFAGISVTVPRLPQGIRPRAAQALGTPSPFNPPAAGDIVITRGGRPTRPDNLSMPLTRRFRPPSPPAALIFAQPAPQKQPPARKFFYAAAPAPAAAKPAAPRPPARRSTATPAK